MNSSMLKIIGLFAIFLIVVTLTSFSLLKDFSKSGSGTNADKTEIEKIVADYIKANPKQIIESVNEYQIAESKKQDESAQVNVKSKINEIENDPASPIAGNPNGSIVIAEFFDYSCGYCKKALATVSRLIEEEKEVKFIFKELPILGPGSELAAKAAIAVYRIDPKKYFAFHTKIMGERINSVEGFMNIAKELNIDTKNFEKTLNSKEVADLIQKDRKLAESIGINGTPAFIINGKLVPGAIDYDSMKSLIESAKAEKGKK